MVTKLPHRDTRPRTTTRRVGLHLPRRAGLHLPSRAGLHLRQRVAVLGAVTGALLSFAAVPAAFASQIPVPAGGGAYGPVPVGAAAVTRVITTGGMAAWQIALIAVGAALVAAAAAVSLDRTLGHRRPVSLITA